MKNGLDRWARVMVGGGLAHKKRLRKLVLLSHSHFRKINTLLFREINAVLLKKCRYFSGKGKSDRLQKAS